MVNLHLTKSYLTGLFYFALVFAVSLPLIACGENSESAQKKTSNNGENGAVGQIFKGVVREINGEDSLKLLNENARSLGVGEKI